MAILKISIRALKKISSFLCLPLSLPSLSFLPLSRSSLSFASSLFLSSLSTSLSPSSHFEIYSIGWPSNLTETSLESGLLSQALKLPPEPTGYSFRCLTSVEHN